MSEEPQRRWFSRDEHGGAFYIWNGKNSYVQFWQQWGEWFADHYNWQNFTLINIAYEDEGHTGHRQVELALLGLCLRILWCYDTEAEGMQIVKERMAEIKAHPECAVELEEILRRSND